jgi:hypothetical protein
LSFFTALADANFRHQFLNGSAMKTSNNRIGAKRQLMDNQHHLELNDRIILIQVEMDKMKKEIIHLSSGKPSPQPEAGKPSFDKMDGLIQKPKSAWVTGWQAAEMLGVCKRTIINNRDKYQIRYQKIFGKIRYSKVDLEKLLKVKP